MKRRRLFPLLILAAAAFGAHTAAGCNEAEVIPLKDCHDTNTCTCEDDPTQQLCRGFNDRPEGGTVPFPEAGLDSSTGDDAADAAVPDASDAATDADDDGGDASDGSM